MKRICEASTGGGPVAIMTLEAAREWTGGWGDYFHVLTQQGVSPLQFFSLGDRCSGWLFYQVDDGDFVVYYQSDEILVLSEGYAPDEAHSINAALPDYEPYIVPDNPIRLVPFGGKVVVFDSVFPGILISLTKTGFEAVAFPHDSDNQEIPPKAPNTVLVEVQQGSWCALPIHRQDKLISFDGILFRLTR
jgi:hypothetical protein